MKCSSVLKLTFIGLVAALGIQKTYAQMSLASPLDSQFRKDFSQLQFSEEGAVAAVADPVFPLNGTGVANAIIVIPPCHAVSPHYHPNSTESNVVIEGNFQYFILDNDKKVASGVLLPKQIVNYPKGFPHMLFNPFKETATVMAVQSFSPPGTFFLNEFVRFTDDAVITGLGQDSKTYGAFKGNTLESNQFKIGGTSNVNKAVKVPDFDQCIARAQNLKVNDLCKDGLCSAPSLDQEKSSRPQNEYIGAPPPMVGRKM